MPDEAIHLAAEILLARFNMADDVYAKLLGGKRKSKVPDASKTAFALHYAMDKLHKRYGNMSFMNWIPYVHIGI
ncbi:hypothetical protein AX16_010883 [Volvariella volvacea WC 439]|nr:hypothetical protein AX16_010883 [Volvariella volvacea WC 439]